jgi:hypothetical protein
MDRQPPERSMTARNIESRIEKLETSQRRPDHLLLVWREPDSDVAAAVANAVYAAGDKMICAEWFGDLPPPAPKWYRDMWFEMDRIEFDYITRSIGRLKEALRREPNYVPSPHARDHRASGLTNDELLHICFGVET